MIWITAFRDLDQYVCIDQYLLASTSSDQQRGTFEPAQPLIYTSLQSRH